MRAPAGGATPYYRSPSGDVTLYCGDATAVLRALPAGSVHSCVTSPPYYQLRDYKADGQIGLERTLGEYVAALVEVFRGVWRVLRDDGTLWLNLGDGYNSASQYNGHVRKDGSASTNLDGGVPRYGERGRYGERADDWPGHRALLPDLKPKNLLGVPWRVAFALQDAGWTLRSDIIWSKPNPMPESVRDRPTRAHEYVFLLSKGPRYFFDQEAVMQPVTGGTHSRGDKQSPPKTLQHEDSREHVKNNRSFMEATWGAVSARNIRSVWEIATEPYPEAHFATFPTKLVEPCLLSGTSARGCCPACGAPWTRVVERTSVQPVEYAGKSLEQGPQFSARRMNANKHARRLAGGEHNNPFPPAVTTGWRAGCACADVGDPIPCTVLDPFCGAGTVSLVARKHGRHSWGIDLSAAYLEMARSRLGQLALPLMGG